MKSFPLPVALSWHVSACHTAHAERADRNKPMNIEADTLRYDDVRQTSVFTGNVVLTKGTIVIRGAGSMCARTRDGNQFGVAKAEPGKRAFFRQKRDTRRGRIHRRRGRDHRIRRQGRPVRFCSARCCAATWAPAQRRMTGNVISYDNTTSVLRGRRPGQTMPAAPRAARACDADAAQRRPRTGCAGAARRRWRSRALRRQPRPSVRSRRTPQVSAAPDGAGQPA
jgi:lipopolysaccharide export system protein LptA